MVGAKPRLVLHFDCSSIGDLSASSLQTLILSELSTRCPRFIRPHEALVEYIGPGHYSSSPSIGTSDATPNFLVPWWASQNPLDGASSSPPNGGKIRRAKGDEKVKMLPTHMRPRRSHEKPAWSPLAEPQSCGMSTNFLVNVSCALLTTIDARICLSDPEVSYLCERACCEVTGVNDTSGFAHFSYFGHVRAANPHADGSATTDDQGRIARGVAVAASHIAMDLAFLLDTSISVNTVLLGGSPGTFESTVVNFAADIANSLTVGLLMTESRVALFTISSTVTRHIRFNDYFDGVALGTAIGNVPYAPTGAFFLSTGLGRVRTDGFTSISGARDSSNRVPRILVVVLDGAATGGYEPAAEAALLRAEGVIIYAVAINDTLTGTLTTEELMDLTGTADHVRILSSWSELTTDAASIGDSVHSIAAQAFAPTLAPTTREPTAAPTCASDLTDITGSQCGTWLSERPDSCTSDDQVLAACALTCCTRTDFPTASPTPPPTPHSVLVTFFENWSAAEIYDLRDSIASLPLAINDDCSIFAADADVIVPSTPFCSNQRWRGPGLTLFAHGSGGTSNSKKKGGSAGTPKFTFDQTVAGCPFLDTSVFEGADGKNCGMRGSRYYCDYWDLSQACQGPAAIPGSAMINACSQICSAVPDCTAFTLDHAVDAESGRCVLHGGALELTSSCFSYGGVNSAVQQLECLDVAPDPAVGLSRTDGCIDPDVCGASSGGRPRTLLFDYTSDGTGASGSMPGGKATVVGEVSGVVQIGCNKAAVLPSVVMPGQGFVLQPTGKRFGTRLRCTLTNGTSTQTVRFSTSCSVELVTGDRFGGIRVVGYNGRSDGCLNPRPPPFLHTGLDQPPDQGDEQVCTRSPTSGKSKKNTKKAGKKRGGMGKKKDRTREKTGSPPSSNPHGKGGTGKHKAKAGANGDSVADVTGGSKLPLVEGVAAAAVCVITGIVGVFLYYRKNLRLSHELAELGQHAAALAQPGRESPSSAAMSWDHDYQLMNAKTAEPQPLYANISEQTDSTCGPRLTTRGDTDSTLDWDDTAWKQVNRQFGSF